MKNITPNSISPNYCGQGFANIPATILSNFGIKTNQPSQQSVHYLKVENPTPQPSCEYYQWPEEGTHSNLLVA